MPMLADKIKRGVFLQEVFGWSYHSSLKGQITPCDAISMK